VARQRHAEVAPRESFSDLAPTTPMATFEDLDMFKRALDLMEDVYRVTKMFPGDERFGLTQQLRRASISVVSNLAEGQGRLTNGEWRQFLSQTRGSLFEIQAQLIAARRLDFLDENEYRKLRSTVRRVAEPLKGLIQYVARRPKAAAPASDS
jgi:four helix bundle protein